MFFTSKKSLESILYTKGTCTLNHYCGGKSHQLLLQNQTIVRVPLKFACDRQIISFIIIEAMYGSNNKLSLEFINRILILNFVLGFAFDQWKKLVLLKTKSTIVLAISSVLFFEPFQ